MKGFQMHTSHSIQTVSIVCFATAVITLAAGTYVDACNNRKPVKIFCTSEPDEVSCVGYLFADCDSKRDDIDEKEADFGETTEQDEKTTQSTTEEGAVCYKYTSCKKENTVCKQGNTAEQKAPIYIGSDC